MQSIRFLISSRLILVVMAYFALMAGGGYWVVSRTIRQSVIDDSRTSLQSIVANIRSNYLARLHDLDEVAKLDGFRPFDPTRAAALIDHFLAFNSVIRTVHVYKADGTLLFAKRHSSIPRYDYDASFRIRPQPEFLRMAEKVIATQRAAISETFYTNKGDLLQTYVLPIVATPPGKTAIGIISGGVFPLRHRLDSLVEGLTLADRNFILITDTKGNTVARSGLITEDTLQVVKPRLPATVDGLLGPKKRSQAVVIEALDQDANTPYVLLSGAIREMNLVVTLGVSTRSVDDKLAELGRWVLLVMVAGLIFTSFAAMVVGNRLSRPLVEIFEVLKALNVGDFSARVRYTANDEIGYLGELINRLSAKIRKDRYLGDLWSNDTERHAIHEPGDQAP
jgi:HAMP domain-containing protein